MRQVKSGRSSTGAAEDDDADDDDEEEEAEEEEEEEEDTAGGRCNTGPADRCLCSRASAEVAGLGGAGEGRFGGLGSGMFGALPPLTAGDRPREVLRAECAWPLDSPSAARCLLGSGRSE